MAGRQHPPQRARLYTAAAHLSRLLGALALDLGAFAVAHATPPKHSTSPMPPSNPTCKPGHARHRA